MSRHASSQLTGPLTVPCFRFLEPIRFSESDLSPVSTLFSESSATKKESTKRGRTTRRRPQDGYREH
ncbi:hypothetical protein HMPREF9004_0620 [Schaalia cardiffensis F0333]|uniref:Uncharacterized protein n=1 Tax=Schaalia cardiffensis F0333 TaxID=888050 RepID=N6X4C8_9ACTO|nr:hypothetical protein HMPREF9004_0620 [Schaalia cardiffensis F0333]